MSAVNEAECLSIAEKLAVAAGELIAEAFKQQAAAPQFELKEENDHVTATDLAAEKLILDGLRTAFPDHVLIGEESHGQPEHLSTSPTWMVDPLVKPQRPDHQLIFGCRMEPPTSCTVTRTALSR